MMEWAQADPAPSVFDSQGTKRRVDILDEEATAIPRKAREL